MIFTASRIWSRASASIAARSSEASLRLCSIKASARSRTELSLTFKDASVAEIASSARAAQAHCGPAFSADSLSGLGVFCFCHRQRRPAFWLHPGSFGRHSIMGKHLRPLAAACIFRFLELNLQIFPAFNPSVPKNFQKTCKIRKISLCNREKVGYNKLE